MRHDSPHGIGSLRSHLRTASIASAAALVVGAASAAPRSPASETGVPPDPVADLLQRVEQLEQRNRNLEGEVVRLRESEGQQWLTEQRAVEIRELVQDVLTDAGSRESLQSSGMTAGWDNGFFLSSADGRFLLQIGGLLQTRYVATWFREPSPAVGLPSIQAYWSDQRTSRAGFDIPGAEIWFQGHAFGKGLTYKLKAGFVNTHAVDLAAFNVRPLETGSGELTLYDAWTRFELGGGFFFRAGQFKLPFSREELIDRQYQLAIEPSAVSWALGVDYSQGLELSYVSDLFRAQVAFSDGARDQVASQYKTAGAIPRNRPFSYAQSEYALTGRFEFKPYGRWRDFEEFTSPPGSDFGLLFGIGLHSQSWRPDYYYQRILGPTGNNQWFMATADVSMNFSGASLYGSFTWANVDSGGAYLYAGQNNFNTPSYADAGTVNKWGMVLQGSFYMMPKIELFARYELGLFSVNNEARMPLVGGASSLYARENHLNLITAGMNWYIDGQDIKFSTDFGWSINSFGPSWFSGSNGWRVSGSSDQLVCRAMLQLLF